MSRPVTKIVRLSNDEADDVAKVLRERNQTHTAFRNATILSLANSGKSPKDIANEVHVTCKTVHTVINKYLKHGLSSCWSDLERSGRPVSISDEAKCYVIGLACNKPTAYGYPHELWTIDLLKQHVRKHCMENNYPELSNASKSTIWRVLNKSDIKPHKIKYYLARTDEMFEEKMKNVLMLYKEFSFSIEQGLTDECFYVSFDDKTAMQALSNIHEDRNPNLKHGFTSRDDEYKRHGTLSLLVSIDLVSGKMTALVRERHRSFEFIEHLKLLDSTYPKGKLIKIVLDNHRAHSSKETMAYLESVPNRFEFVFTPKHGSWLNLIEGWIGKLSQVLLCGMRVKSKEELSSRIMAYIDLINEAPVAPKWRYKLDELDV